MLLRIKREIYKPGSLEEHFLASNTVSVASICERFHLDREDTRFYGHDGKLIKGDMIIKQRMVTAVQVPSAATITASTIAAAIAVIAGTLIVGIIVYDVGNKFGWWGGGNAKLVYSNSLRGATNPIRKGKRIGILLGSYKVNPDVAGLVYSSYDGESNQYVHQLFCSGYRDAVISKSASFISAGNPKGYKLYIGESPIDLFDDAINIEVSNGNSSLAVHENASDAGIDASGTGDTEKTIADFAYYNKRCVEEGLSISLIGPDASSATTRTSPTGTVRIGVGIAAPYGYYTTSSSGNMEGLAIKYRIDYKLHTDAEWTLLVNVDQMLNATKYRIMHTAAVEPGQYDVRVYRTAADSEDAHDNDRLLLELIQFDTISANAQSTLPVVGSERYALIGLKAKATDKLTGYIDQLYAECFLNCRVYTAIEESDDWTYWVKPSNPATIGDCANPAAVLLYVLTDAAVNPRCIDISTEAGRAMIDWHSFSEWFLFCKEKGWTCNAWITEDMNIGQLCSLICAAGRARFRIMNGRHSILIERDSDVIAQMFTPRNAWNMQESRSFEETPDLVKVTFVNAEIGEEDTRMVRIDSDGIVHYDEDIPDESIYKTETIDVWGVTNPSQIASLAAYKLAQLKLQTTTYTWSCSLENLACTIGDIVYLANDMFLSSLGYGRIVKVYTDVDENITAIDIDETVGIDPLKNYGVTIRRNDGGFSSVPVNQSTSDSTHLIFTVPIAAGTDVQSGNLFMYGDSTQEGKRVIIQSIKPDADKNATITAVDYIPGIYDIEGTIPAYVPTISRYGSGANLSKGAMLDPLVSKAPAGPPGADGVDAVAIEVLSSNGWVYRTNAVSTTLSIKATQGAVDATDRVPDASVRWYRTSELPETDADWNASEKAIGHKSVYIGNADVHGRTSFRAEVDLTAMLQ